MTERSDAEVAATWRKRAAPPARRHLGPLWRFLRRHPNIGIGGLIVAVMILIAILAPFLGTADPRALSPVNRLKPPSATSWFGTDMLGRDLYSRVMYGARVSLVVGFLVALLSALLGTAVAMLAASSRFLDPVVMRVMDGLMSIPSVLLAIALMAVSQASLRTVVTAITIVEVPRVARLIRGAILGLREQPFVEASIVAGSPMIKVIWRHLLPGIYAPLMVQATFIWAGAMIIEAMLSFIGAGVPPTTPSWGNIMADNRTLWQVKPGLVFVPAGFLCLTVLGVNLLGDGLRDVLDPRMAKRI